MGKKSILVIFLMLVLFFIVGCTDVRTIENTTNSTVFQDLSSAANLTGNTTIHDIITSNSASAVDFQQTKETKPQKNTTKSDFKPVLTQKQESEKYTVVYTFPPSTFDGYDNEALLNEKISVSYNESDIVNRYLYYQYFPSASGVLPKTFEDISKEYPVECMRKTGENLYAVYQTEQGGLMYMFFTPDMKLYYSAYSMKKLSYADFGEIKAGDSFEKISAVDPAAQAMKTAYETNSNSVVFYSVHILSDGLFVVFYNETETGEYTVWKAEYYPDYTFNNYKFFIEIKPEYAVDNTNYSYKILTKDYID